MPGVPGRGERIGSAFVRVFITGDNQGLKDLFDDPEVAKEAKKAGEVQGDARNEAWLEKLRESVDEEKKINELSNTNFEESVRARGAFIERLLNDTTNEQARLSGVIDKTREHVDDLELELEHASRLQILLTENQRTSLQETIKQTDELVASTQAEQSTLSGLIDRTRDHHRNMIQEMVHGNNLVKASTQDLEATIRDTINTTDDLSTSIANENQRTHALIERTTSDMEDLNFEFEHNRTLLVRLGDEGATTFDRVDKGVNKDHDSVLKFLHTIEKLGDETEKFGHKFDEVAVSTGRLFGKGSRNNLLNFVGSVTTNIIRTFAAVFSTIGKVVTLITDKLIKAFDKTAQEGAKAGEEAAGGFSAMFEAVAPVIGAVGLIAIGFLALGESLSLVAALISGIAAALIALAGSLAFALVGALSAVAGALLPIALGIGGIVLALATMSDKTKKALAQDLKPFLDEARKLGDVFREGFGEGIGSAVDRGLARLHELQPLFRAIGVAVGDLVRRFNNLFDKPAVKGLMDELQTFIPEALHDLGRIILNTIRGLATLFTQAIPDANRFLDFLIRVTREFRIWAHQNPQAIRHFLDEAAESAQALLDLIGAIGDTIKIVFFSGRDTGDSIIGRLTKNIQAFNDLLRPKGGKTIFDEQIGGIKQVADQTPLTDPLAGFFAHGEEVANSIGDIAVGLGQIFDQVDDPRSRENLQGLLDILSDIGALAPFIGATADAVNKVGFAIPRISLFGFQHAFDFIFSLPRRIRNAIRNIRDALGGLGGPGSGTILSITPPSLAFVPRVIARLSTIATRAAEIGRQAAADLSAPFQVVPGIVGGIAVRAANRLLAPWGVTVQQVASLIRSIPGRLGALAAQFATLAATWTSVIFNQFVDLPRQIVSLFFGLGSEISSAIGNVIVHFIPDTSGIPRIPGLPDTVLPGPLATGGLFTKPTFGLFGEAGPEAIVPLSGPLSAVDPSVRALSALARGLQIPGTSSSGKTIDIGGITIITPNKDPELVAWQVINRLSAATML